MKTLMMKFTSVAGVALLLICATTAGSCKKDKTCTGIVHVIDTAGAVVGNAAVELSAPSVDGDVTYTGITDASGDVTFEVALPAIFDVRATKGTYPGMEGLGVIRLDEPGKEDKVTVTIQ